MRAGNYASTENFPEAMAESRRRWSPDPSSAIAISRLKRLQDQVNHPQGGLKPEDRGATPEDLRAGI